MGARAVQLLLRCPHTPRLAPAKPDARFGFAGEGDGRSPVEGSSQRAELSVGRGRLHPALPVEGDGRSPEIGD
ncbi:MAG: hypothetical protein HZA13_05470 [Nitrospirae bacterium]|nr:hypothetical protein [Nitrospirota bacterium]